MRAGYLTDRVSFLTNVSVKDEYGAKKNTWELIKVIRAEVKQNDGKRAVVNAAEQVIYPIRIITHYKHKIDESWRVKHDGKLYVISSVVRSRSSMTTTIVAEQINE